MGKFEDLQGKIEKNAIYKNESRQRGEPPERRKYFNKLSEIRKRKQK